MAIPMLNLGLGLSLQRLSHNFTTSPISPKSGFADSELGKLISNKIVLSKYSAVLKRKGNKAVNLKELDTLQLELETLLLASINRKNILLKECSLLEKEHNADISTQHDTIHQQIVPNVRLTSDSIKFTIPAPITKRKLSRKKDSLDKSPAPQSIVAPQFTTHKSETKRQKIDASLDFTTDSGEINSELPTKAQSAELDETNTPAKNKRISRKPTSLAKAPQPTLESQFTENKSEKNNQKDDTGLDSTTNSGEFNSELTKMALPVELNETNTPLATSTSSKESDQGNSSPVQEKKSNTSTKTQNLELPKTVLDKKTARAIRMAQTRNANTINRIFTPARKYWHSVRSMCRYISETEIKAFEEVMKEQESLNKVSKDLPVEGFFASEWAESELNEEKNIASTNLMPRKATRGASEDVLNMMRRAKKLVDQEKSSESVESEPLFNHLLQSLRHEKLINETKNKYKPVKVLPSAVEERTLSNNSDIEEAMRADLVRAGILTKEQIVRADSIIEKTDIDVEIQQLRGTLNALIKYNKEHFNHVVKLGKLEVRKHTLTKQLLNKGRDIEKAYMSILAFKKKNESVKNPIKKALKLVQEREVILSELNDLTCV